MKEVESITLVSLLALGEPKISYHVGILLSEDRYCLVLHQSFLHLLCSRIIPEIVLCVKTEENVQEPQLYLTKKISLSIGKIFHSLFGNIQNLQECSDEGDFSLLKNRRPSPDIPTTRNKDSDYTCV
jgi:hypothetical protein